MIDTDLFGQWINFVPDDLPPVDEDGLNDLASLDHQVDRFIENQRYEPSSGLLLACPNAPQVGAAAVQIASDPSPLFVPYASLCPPALSPDSSPYSIASSTPWLRTPTSDPSLANVATLTPVNGLWDIGAEELCDTNHMIHFVDQLGNSLEDPLQVHNVMLEDIACTPQTFCDNSLRNAPSFIISPPHRASTLHQDEVVPPIHCPLRASSSPHLQSLFMYSPMTHYSQESSLSGHPASPSLSPLSTLSFLSQSPSASPSYLPPVDYSSASPALSPIPISHSDERVEVTSPIPSTLGSVTLVNLQGKRNMRVVDEDDPVFGIPRRSKAKERDDEEWNPASGRVKRLRVAAFPQSTSESPLSNPSGLVDESTVCEPTEGSEGYSGATNTCCECCGQSFTRGSDLVRHMENSANHPKTRKMWPCRYCDSMLGRKDALVRHIRTLHPKSPVLIQVEGILESGLPDSQKETFVQRMAQRKMTLRRQPQRDTRSRNR